MKTVLVAAAALALTPLAHAQPTCSQLTRIVEAAPAHFEPLWGAEAGLHIYEAAEPMPGAKDCEIRDVVDSVFVCVWHFPDAAAADAAFREGLKQASECLQGWRRERINHGVSLEKRLDGAHVSLGLWTTSPQAGSGETHVLSIEARRWHGE